MERVMSYGQNPFNLEAFLNSLKGYADWANTSDPRLTPAGQLSRDLTVGAPGILMQKLGQPIQNVIEGLGPTVAAAGQGLQNFASVPQGQLMAEAQAQAAAQAPQLASSPEMIANWLAQQGQGGSPASMEIPMGPAIEIPNPPELPMPQAPDFSAMQQWLDKSAPQQETAPDNSRQQIILSAIAGALQGNTVADMLAGAGAGALQGKLSTEEARKQQEREYANQQRQYAAARAEAEQSMAQRKAQFDSQVAETTYRNNMARYQTQLKNLVESQPQILGVKDGIVQMLLTENGQRVIKMVDPTAGGQSSAVQALARQAGATPDEAGQLAASSVGLGPIEVLTAITNDLKTTGTWAQILPEDVRSNVVQRVTEQLAATGLEGAERAKMFDRLLSGELMALLSSSPELLARAATGSTLAASLVRSSLNDNTER